MPVYKQIQFCISETRAAKAFDFMGLNTQGERFV